VIKKIDELPTVRRGLLEIIKRNNVLIAMAGTVTVSVFTGLLFILNSLYANEKAIASMDKRLEQHRNYIEQMTEDRIDINEGLTRVETNQEHILRDLSSLKAYIMKDNE